MEIKTFINGELNPSTTIALILEKNDKREMILVANALTQQILVLTVDEKLPRSAAIKNRTSTSLTTIWEIWERVKREEEKDNLFLQMQQGADFYYAEKKAKLPYPAAIPLWSNQALGFAKGFLKGGIIDGKLIQKVIEDIKHLNIRADFGVNDLRTGKDILTWIFRGKALALSFKGSEKSSAELIKKYGDKIKKILISAAPNSIEIEENKEEDSVYFILQWK